MWWLINKSYIFQFITSSIVVSAEVRSLTSIHILSRWSALLLHAWVVSTLHSFPLHRRAGGPGRPQRLRTRVRTGTPAAGPVLCRLAFGSVCRPLFFPPVSSSWPFTGHCVHNPRDRDRPRMIPLCCPPTASRRNSKGL